MRLGTKSSDKFIEILNQKNQQIQDNYLKTMKTLTKTISIKGMLGDSTIREQDTFDPTLVQNYYNDFSNKLPNWSVRDISIANNDDLRRIFIKFHKKIGDYLVSCHLSIQFHVLLYYKPDNNVIKYQKELSEIINKTKDLEKNFANSSDQFVLKKLEEFGYNDLEHKELFKILYENDDIREKIYHEIENNQDSDVQSLIKRKKDLFNALDNLLMETYQTSPVLIDDAKLVTGEEGVLCTIDLEKMKNNSKETIFDPKKIPENTKKELLQVMDELSKIMKL